MKASWVVFGIRLALASMASLLACLPLTGQNPQLQTKNGRRFPTVVFTSVFWGANPSYYSIAIDSAGTSTYQSAPDSLEKTGVPYSLEFQASDRTRRTIFNLVQELEFFSQPVQQSTVSPETGSVRTLTYHDIQLNNQITYSTSSDPEMQEITSVFEEISETLEYGRRLNYFHGRDMKALAEELKSMQASADRHHLRELEVLTPVLNGIASDRNLDNEVRQQAEALVKRERVHF